MEGLSGSFCLILSPSLPSSTSVYEVVGTSSLSSEIHFSQPNLCLGKFLCLISADGLMEGGGSETATSRIQTQTYRFDQNLQRSCLAKRRGWRISLDLGSVFGEIIAYLF